MFRSAIVMGSCALWLALGDSLAIAAEWKPAPGRLLTDWAAQVSPENVHSEYPRPQLVRQGWTNLNGLWNYTITPRDAETPTEFGERILVPFPIESALSGVMKPVGVDNRLWCQRTFRLSPTKGKRVLLHFGAVDWQCVVYLNGKEIGSHEGGYDPFSFDITEHLSASGKQELLVAVWDPSDRGTQPRGKQVEKPEGIWYTSVTGIWQTVWLEEVPETYLQDLRIEADLDRGEARITAATNAKGVAIQVEVFAENQVIANAQGMSGEAVVVKIPNVRAWSPDDPFLYGCRARVVGGENPDSVRGYFGVRKIHVGKDEKGTPRIFLNNKPLFQYGPLDQGWWPDGLYTAPNDEALRYDIEITKKLGFNMTRKHVKVEPARWYYWCDRLGLLVWQDMPNGDAHVGPGDGEITRTTESDAIYRKELQAMIDARRCHPSIVMWVPFNEGWGQYETARTVEWIRKYDSTRLVNAASGWNDIPGVGDAHDIHVYPGPAAPPTEETRVAILGEFGGLGLPVAKHTWQDEKNWGYRSYENKEKLGEAYHQLLWRLRMLIEDGLTAAVYTQLTDVEIEVNGVLTYDRKVNKFDLEKFAAASRRLYAPPPQVSTIVPTGRASADAQWQYTVEAPAADWFQPDFNDDAWSEGAAGFGTEGTPGVAIRTRWDTPEIWARREVELTDEPGEGLCLVVHHDEDTMIYINGELAADLKGYVTDYTVYPLSAEGRRALRKGKNTIAAYCKQTGGGQSLDIGVAKVVERNK